MIELPSTVNDVVVISDLHAGSRSAPCPLTFPLRDGATYQASSLQASLTFILQSIRKRILTQLDGRKFALVLNGDLVEGSHHDKAQLVDPDPLIHRRIARDLLMPWVNASHSTYLVRGTRCHVGDMEEELARDFGAVPIDGTQARYRLHMKVRGSEGIFSHHISTSTRDWSGAAALSNVLAAERLEAAKADWPLPRWIVRSHRHQYGMYSDGDGVVVTTPALQATTDFTHKIIPHIKPVVGLVLLSFPKDAKVPTVTPFLERVATLS